MESCIRWENACILKSLLAAFACIGRPINIASLCVRLHRIVSGYWCKFEDRTRDGWSLLLMSTHLPKGARTWLKRQVSAAHNRTSASTACFYTSEWIISTIELVPKNIGYRPIFSRTDERSMQGARILKPDVSGAFPSCAHNKGNLVALRVGTSSLLISQWASDFSGRLAKELQE